jgi:ribosomal protein L15
VTKNETIPRTARHPKHGNENSNMFSKEDLKNLFQSSIKEMLTKRKIIKRKKLHRYG